MFLLGSAIEVYYVLVLSREGFNMVVPASNL